MTRPRMNAGSTAWPFEASASTISTKQAGEDKLDLGLDHAVAVAAEERRRDPRQRRISATETSEEDGEPDVRLDEDRRERDARCRGR